MKTESDQIRVLLASSIHRWNDVRIYHKEASSLSSNYDVTVMGVGLSNEINLSKKKVSVILLPLPKTTWQRLQNAGQILGAGISGQFRLIHFHDPELIWVGLLLKLFRKKIIYDVHEDLQAAIQIRRWIPQKLKGIVGYFAHMLELLGQWVFNGIIVAEDSYLPIFSKNNQIVAIRNYVRIYPDRIPLDGQSKRILYAGSVTMARGVGDLLRAIAVLQEKDRYIGATIIGNCPISEVDGLEKLKKKLPNPEMIEIIGFTDFDEIKSFVSNCRLAVVPLRRERNYERSIPTKILDYMNWGIPFIFSRLELTEQLFGEDSGGIGFKPGNIQELVKAIHKLLIDDNLHEKLRREGRKKVDKYNWTFEEAKLLRFYEQIIFTG